MKRKLHLMMAVAIVAVAGLAIYANQPKEEMSDGKHSIAFEVNRQ